MTAGSSPVSVGWRSSSPDSSGKCLHELAPGESARIIQISGRREYRRRLQELGFTPGTVVTVMKRAPLGDPVELNVRSYDLAIRSNVAEKIRVSMI